MKTYSLSLLFLLIITSIKAQNTNLDYQHSIKVYNLSSFEEYSISRKVDNSLSNRKKITKDKLTILHPTFAFQWKDKKSNFHEIELTHFMLGLDRSKSEFTNDSADIKTIAKEDKTFSSNISIRYEYIHNFRKNKECKLAPSLGLGLNPYYYEINEKPSLSSYATSSIFFGTRIFITPRLTYYFSPKFFLDANLPFCLTDFNYVIEKENSPALAQSEKTISYFNLDGFPKIYSGRIGIGFKL